MPGESPIRQVEELKQRGLTNDQVIQNLQAKGFNSQQIYEALNQSDVKMGVNQPSDDMIGEPPSPDSEFGVDEGMQPSLMDAPAPRQMAMPQMPPSQPEMPEPEIPVPSSQDIYPQQNYQQDYYSQQPQSQPSSQDLEETVELIISEKWSQLIEKIGDFQVWKEKTRMELEAIKQEVLRMRGNFENLQNALISKVNEYNRNITNINSEMKAMEKVFEKILEPMTSNIKELGRLTEKLKKAKDIASQE